LLIRRDHGTISTSKRFGRSRLSRRCEWGA
jgi:hypothetical protein